MASGSRKPLALNRNSLLRRSTTMTKMALTIDDETRAENAELVDELKTQLQKAERASEQYQRQRDVFQLRLDELLRERATLEERQHLHDAEIMAAKNKVKESDKATRELLDAHNTEKTLLLRDRDEKLGREVELQLIIQRLNETVRSKNRPNLSRSCLLSLPLASLCISANVLGSWR